MLVGTTATAVACISIDTSATESVRILSTIVTMLLDRWETSLLLSLSLPYTAFALPPSNNGDHFFAPQSSGSDPAKTTTFIPVQEVDYHWVANVSIGGQEVLLCIDTGSSPL